MELSRQEFFIPFLGTDVNYVVTEEKDLDSIPYEEDSAMTNISNCVRNIQLEMRTSLTKVERLEELVSQVQEVSKRASGETENSTVDVDIVDVAGFGMDGIDQQDVENGGSDRQEVFKLVEKRFAEEEIAENCCDVTKHGDAIYLSNKNNEECQKQVANATVSVDSAMDAKLLIDGAVAFKGEKQNCVDDYGFSDTEDDVSDDLSNVYPSRQAQSRNVDEDMKSLKGFIGEKVSDDKMCLIETPSKQPILSEQRSAPVSLQQMNKTNHSRPRCVRRISVHTSHL